MKLESTVRVNWPFFLAAAVLYVLPFVTSPARASHEAPKTEVVASAHVGR